MSYDSKYKGAEAEALFDKVNEDYEVKSYADYADYNADTSRVNKTISFVEQDSSVWVQGKQYSMNAGCYVGSDKAGTSTTAWYLAGTLNVAIIGWDIQCLGYCTNSLLSEGGGLFVLNLRFNSATDIQIKKFAWLAKTGSTPNLRLVVSEGKVQLYVFVAGGQYRGANIRILTESTSAKRAITQGARNFFELSDNITPETTEPVGTDIADVPYLLKNGTAAQAAKVLQTNSALSKERRVLLGGDNDDTKQDDVCKSANLTFNPSTKTLTVPKINGNSASATGSVFLQSLEGLCHKSIDSSLGLYRRTEYICGQQVLSDTEEAGKVFYGSSANPLVISVPFKDPGDAVAGSKVNVNIIRFYYADTYWHELFFGVNSPSIYTRWVAGGNARPWYRMMKEDSTIEYNAWVTKATTADSAAVANKTKYPIVFKRNGASITNWFADTTFTIDIPEELLNYSAPTGIALKVPEIDVANEAKKVSNDLEIKVNGVQQVSFDGSSAKTVNIRANKTHFVKAANYGNGWTSPTAGATTPGIPLVLDTSYMIPLGQLMDGDTIIMQVPNTLTSTSTYPVYLQLDATEGIVTGNIVKIIKAQNAGTPVEWKGTTALTAGYYHFVYSEGAGGLIFMYRNVATS